MGLYGGTRDEAACDREQLIGFLISHPEQGRAWATVQGIGPAEICFVSANGWDIAGAANAGCRAVWLNRRGLPPERLPAGPVATITSLTELPPLLP